MEKFQMNIEKVYLFYLKLNPFLKFNNFLQIHIENLWALKMQYCWRLMWQHVAWIFLILIGFCSLTHLNMYEKLNFDKNNYLLNYKLFTSAYVFLKKKIDLNCLAWFVCASSWTNRFESYDKYKNCFSSCFWHTRQF